MTFIAKDKLAGAITPDHAYKQKPRKEKVYCGFPVPKNHNYPAHPCGLFARKGETRCRFHKQKDPNP